MKLINNRYRIMECLESDSNYCKYIVNDLIKRNEVVYLYTINDSDVTKPFIDFCIDKFYSIAPINHPNILSVYTFGLIEHVDDKPVNETKYFYTTEFYSRDILNLNKKLFSKEDILETYIQISRTLYFLHFRGIVYRYLNIETLMIKQTQDGLHIKLLDLVSLQRNSLNKQLDDNSTMGFLAPELIHDGEIDEYTDVYSLGVIMYYLKTMEFYKPSKLSKQIETCINDNSMWDLAFFKLIYNMTQLEHNKRIQSVHDVNRRVKQLHNHTEDIKDKTYIERLNFKTPIVGRNTEIKKVLSTSFNYKDNISSSLVVIEGNKGIGKTRLINELMFKMQLNRVKYVNISVNEEEAGFYKIMPKILKQFYKVAPIQILDKYSKELVKLTPEIGSNITVKPSKELQKDKEILRLYDRVTNFIIEISSIQPIVIAIDDFHLTDISFIRFLEYLFNVNQIKKAPILQIISINEDSLNLSESYEFVRKCSVNSSVTNLRLSRLSLDETAQMVKNILGYLRYPIDIATQIYQETEGIPSLIEEILRQLFAQKLLLIEYNKETLTYEWKIKVQDYSKLKLHSNIDDAVLNQINSFSELRRELLDVISIFNTSTSIDLISKTIGTNIDLSLYFDELTKLKILNEKLEDWGYTYGFNSLHVKNYIYNSLDDNKRLSLHKRASELLEELYEREGRENKDELIFHLIKSNQLDKVINNCIESGENMFRLRIYSQALIFYERAFELITDYKDKRCLEVMMKIGQTNQNLGKNREAIEAFEEVIRISEIINNIERSIDARNMIGYINLLRNDLYKAVDYFQHCIDDAEKINYYEGLFRAAYLLSKTYVNTAQIKEMEEISEKYLDLAYKYNRFDYVGIFLSKKGIAKHIKGYSLDAIKYFNDSVMYLEKGEKAQETSGPINSIGLIYLEYFQDIKTARKYFEKALSIAQLYHRVEDMVRAYSNIADSYMMDGEYELAVNVLNKNISLSIEYEDEIVRFLSYVKLVECYIYLEEYKKAYSSLLKAQREVFNYPIQSVYNERFLEVSIIFYNAMGCYEKVIELVDGIHENFKGLNFRIKQRLRLIKFFAKKNSDIFVSDDELMEILNNYKKTSFVRDKRIANFEAGIYFHLNGNFDLSLSIYESDCELAKLFNNDFFNIRNKFLGAILKREEDSITNLENLLAENFTNRYDEIKWVIYCTLGELYLQRNEFFKATNYFLSALDTIKGLFNKTPDEFKGKYLLSDNKPTVKQRLLYMESLLSNKGHSYNWDNKKIDLKNYFDVSPLKSLIQNPDFYRLALEQYKEQFPIQIDSVDDLISKFTNDTHNNLELTIGLISKNILASSCQIIMKIDNKYNKVVSLGNEIELSDITHILKKIESSGEVIYINNTDVNQTTEKNYIHREAKALVCLPIFNKDTKNTDELERRKDADANTILGFLYLQSDIVFHNFSLERIEESKKLLPLIATLLDSYYLKIYSSIDKLTGVYERKFFEKIFKEHMIKSSSSNQPFCIIMCDVDYFKSVNDTYGHQKGDKVLAEAGSIIKNSIRRTDYVARYGGEEFIVLLPNTIKEEAFLIAEKIRNKFIEENLLGSHGQLTISCGVSAFPEDSSNQETIIEKADQALYKAKDLGRNRCVIWKDGMDFTNKRLDKLAGIITGNVVEDQRNVLVLVNAIDMISKQGTIDSKLYELLGIVMDVLEAEEGMVFELDKKNTKIRHQYLRKRLTEGWVSDLKYNKKLIDRVINTKQGEYLIDWEDISSIDVLTGSPNWKSVITVPIIHNGEITAIIYFTALTKHREFDYNSYNLVKLTSSIIAALLISPIT